MSADAKHSDETAELSTEELDAVSGGMKHTRGTTEHDEKPLQMSPDTPGRPMGTAVGNGGGAVGI